MSPKVWGASLSEVSNSRPDPSRQLGFVHLVGREAPHDGDRVVDSSSKLKAVSAAELS
jgi:hypothetical protein